MEQKHRRSPTDVAILAPNDVVPLSSPSVSSSRIPTRQQFIAEKAKPILEEAAERGEHVSKTTLARELRIQYSVELQQIEEARLAQRQSRQKSKPAVELVVKQPVAKASAETKPEPRQPTRAQLRRREAAAAKEAKRANEPKPASKPSNYIPTDAEYLRARATTVVAEAHKRGDFVTKGEVIRRLQVELKDDLEKLEQRRQQQRRTELIEREARAERPRPADRPLRRSFYETNQPTAKEKKSDKRRQRREARIREEALADKAAAQPVFASPQECVAVARELMARKDKSAAARLLAGAAHKLAPHDPVRFELAVEMGKANGAARAVGVLQPLLRDEQHAERAEVMLATFQLAQGQSRIAFDMLAHIDRSSIRSLKAAAQLSWAIRTDDADGCDKALTQLAEARFSNDKQVLNVDLSAYPGMPAQVRLCAGTLKYANHLGEALMRGNRLHEAVQIYDTLSPGQPTCSDERRDFIRALKSCGAAYYEYGLANRKALGQLSVPHSATIAWSEKEERIALAQTADRYLDRSFQRLYKAFELNGTDDTLRQNLARVIELTGNPQQFEKVNQRVHRRQKTIEALRKAPDSADLLKQMRQLSQREELSGAESRLLRELQRSRQASLLVEQQRQQLIDLITNSREVTDKPAHMPSALARGRRMHVAPRR